MHKPHPTLLILAIVASVGIASAAAPSEKSDPRAAIAAKFPGVKAEDIRPSVVKGVYEVPIGADVAYVSADGRYLIAGDLYEIDTRTNLTEATRLKTRTRMLAQVDRRDMIIFKPANVKHSITVFTDVECGYCRKLHSQIAEINKLGIEVRYLAYPRGGPGSEDWRKMEAVWCSKDRNTALTKAKQGVEIKAGKCDASAVAQQFQLGEDLGVQGTPAIFTASGDYIGGYLPPVELARALEASAQRAKSGS
ncbi:MAG TPA: thioredoxin fold domain-containing protein [Steroidobacteraceae bacterium]